MRQIVQTAVRLLYPPRCSACGGLVDTDFGLCGACWRDTPFIGSTICEKCGIELPGDADGHVLQCDDCMQMPRPWDQGRAALLYRGQARKLILGLKHGDKTEIARIAAGWMARAAHDLIRPGMLVAPVPLHWARLLKRRYNQSALLARAVADETGLEHCPDLLARTKKTPPLEGKSFAERHMLVRDAVSVHPKHEHKLPGRPVLLVDDVMTSGATLAACTNACIDAGAGSVCVLVLARVEKDH